MKIKNALLEISPRGTILVTFNEETFTFTVRFRGEVIRITGFIAKDFFELPTLKRQAYAAEMVGECNADGKMTLGEVYHEAQNLRAFLELAIQFALA